MLNPEVCRACVKQTIHEWEVRGGKHFSAGKKLMAKRIKQGKCAYVIVERASGSMLSIAKGAVIEFTEPQPFCKFSAEHAVSQNR